MDSPSQIVRDLDEGLREFEHESEGLVERLWLGSATILGGPTNIGIQATVPGPDGSEAPIYTKPTRMLGRLIGGDKDSRATFENWAKRIAAERGFELEISRSFELDNIEEIGKTPATTLLEVLKAQLRHVLSHMPADMRLCELTGWIFDKSTEDRRMPESEAWLMCRAVFTEPKGKEHSVTLYRRSWPERYDRDLGDQIKAFWSWVEQHHEVKVFFVQ